jgi:hypothetical protein
MEGWVIGVLLTIVSAAGSTSGLILQKIAHKIEQKAVTAGKQSDTCKCFDIPCNKYFISGFIMLAFVPLPFDFIALANAGQSIILPVGTGCTVIFGQLLAPKVLGEKLTKLDIVATFLITVGTILSMATGTHESPTYTAKRLLYLYTLTPFIISMIFVFVTTCICLIITHVPKFEDKLFESAKIPLLAYIPSSLGAVQIMVFKVVGELTKNTFAGYEETYIGESKGFNDTNDEIAYKTRIVKTNEFLNPMLYLYIFLVVTLAIGQLSYLNRGLARYNAIKFLPIYNTTLLMVGVTCGAIYFQEYEAFHPIWFPIGCFLEVSGILVLSWKIEENKLDVKHDKNTTLKTARGKENEKKTCRIAIGNTNLTKVIPS